MKKAAEADASRLVAAHNKFSIAYSAYTTEVDAYNKKVEAKETALAVAIAFESFHPVKDKISTSYTKVGLFEKVDEAYDPETGVCPGPFYGVYPSRPVPDPDSATS